MLEVLIVDDDPSQLHIRAAVLRSAGLAVQVAATVDSALAFLRAAGDKVGLVITDHLLPERSGTDLVREMRLTCR
jgi:DNA-binding NtrC family response regulator